MPMRPGQRNAEMQRVNNKIEKAVQQLNNYREAVGQIRDDLDAIPTDHQDLINDIQGLPADSGYDAVKTWLQDQTTVFNNVSAEASNAKTDLDAYNFDGT